MEPNSFLAKNSHLLTASVLSIAEGEGRNAVFLATQRLDVHAVDSSHAGLAKAAELAASKNVTISNEKSHGPKHGTLRSAWAGDLRTARCLRRRLRTVYALARRTGLPATWRDDRCRRATGSCTPTWQVRRSDSGVRGWDRNAGF